MTYDQIAQLKKNIANAPAHQRKEAEEVYDLAMLGVWARDSVMPLLRKLPAEAAMDLPPAEGAKEPTKTTIQVEVDKVFAACPQKDLCAKQS